LLYKWAQAPVPLENLFAFSSGSYLPMMNTILQGDPTLDVFSTRTGHTTDAFPLKLL